MKYPKLSYHLIGTAEQFFFTMRAALKKHSKPNKNKSFVPNFLACSSLTRETVIVNRTFAHFFSSLV